MEPKIFSGMSLVPFLYFLSVTSILTVKVSAFFSICEYLVNGER